MAKNAKGGNRGTQSSPAGSTNSQWRSMSAKKVNLTALHLQNYSLRVCHIPPQSPAKAGHGA